MKMKYFIGVDGGGTKTKVLIADEHKNMLAKEIGGPSSLGLGVEQAWSSILALIHQASTRLRLELPFQEVALACGLAGANILSWRQAFIQAAPAFGKLIVKSDAYTSLIGASRGKPAVILALGTGSIGAVFSKEKQFKTVGGFGFPSGDEVSGAWFGMHLINYLQHGLDGRGTMDALAFEIAKTIDVKEDQSLLLWQAQAKQKDYASLAPIIVSFKTHAFVQTLLLQAQQHLCLMIKTLDPTAQLPIYVLGGLAELLRDIFPKSIQQRLQNPQSDASEGALLLACQEIIF